MEDDEDCYGFGALSDMFDDRSSTTPASTVLNGAAAAARAAVEPKRLDVAAMSRFWWSERRLSEFRRGPQRQAKEYHHIAAKFDGMRVDGGLGSAFLVPRSRSDSTGRVEDGGVLWVQAQASDSNAQAKRKKEFQDITNRQDALKTPKGSSKSTATVFLSMSEILDAKETRVQNTVQGITFTLRSGPQFEISFMPGPFYDARNRNEMLEAFNRQQVDDVFSPESSPHRPLSRQLPGTSRASSRAASPEETQSLASSREPTPRNSPGNTPQSTSVAGNGNIHIPTAPREANRQLIRRYAQIDKGSAEAIAIAQKIHSSTEYHVGPLAAQIPDFSADMAYRRQTCASLDRKMKKLTHSWALSEKERELHTRARWGKARNDTIQYTDTITHQLISSTTYEERYMAYVEAECPETHPVIRLVQPRIHSSEASTRRSSPQQRESLPPTENVVRSTSPVRSEDEVRMLFGIDVGASSIVDAAFMSKLEVMPCPTDEDLAGWGDLVDESIFTQARTSFATHLSGMIQKLPVRSVAVLSANGANFHDSESRRRSTSRRRSLDQPNMEEIRSQFNVSARGPTGETDSPNFAKRRRSDGDASPTASRRRRRQSLVGTLDTSLLEEEKVEESTPAASGVIQPMDTICPLCCDADAVVVMKPCGHSVCRKCWGRLARVQNASPGEGLDTRQCPWDRETVVERTDGSTAKTISLQQSVSTSQRLHQWREQALIKQSKQVAAAEERKRQEDDYFVAVRSKIVSLKSVTDATERNYEVAQDIQWRKLELKTQLEREASIKEQRDCTFRPQLFAAPSKLAHVSPRYQKSKRTKKVAVASATGKECKTPPQNSTHVFERLYSLAEASKREKNSNAGRHQETHGHELRMADMVEFLRRQEQLQRAREEKLNGLAEATRCSFSPELSQRTRELSLATRSKPIEELLLQERERRQRKLSKCLGRETTHPRTSGSGASLVGSSPSKSQSSKWCIDTEAASAPDNSSVFDAPTAFAELLLVLQDQEERMKTLERDRPPSPSRPHSQC